MAGRLAAMPYGTVSSASRIDASNSPISSTASHGCSASSADAAGPRTFTLACRPSFLDQPSDLAERLPKALIHRNVPGEPVHALFAALDRCWATAAPFTPYGPRARWVETARLLAADGWPIRDTRKRWRQGELTLDWSAVTPT